MLDETETSVALERNARKEPLTDDEARALLDTVDQVLIAKGKKLTEHAASAVEPDQLKGPTGNYRAPMVRRGKTLLVGFHPDALRELL